MSINVNNHSNMSPRFNPNDDSGNVKQTQNATIDLPKDETKYEESKSEVQITHTAVQLNNLFEEISLQPAINKDRVETIKSKIAHGELDILNFGDRKSTAADRIAEKLIDMEINLFKE